MNKEPLPAIIELLPIEKQQNENSTKEPLTEINNSSRIEEFNHSSHSEAAHLSHSEAAHLSHSEAAHLSHSEAVEAFVKVATETLASHQLVQSKWLIGAYAAKPFVLMATVATIVLLLGYYYRYLPSLIEGILVFMLLLINGGLVMRESRLAATEMPFRLQDASAFPLFQAIDLVKKYGISSLDDIHFSNTSTPSVAITRVLRDGKARLIPCNLLVQGDIVLLGLGDKAPSKVQHVNTPNNNLAILERDQILKPSFLKQIGRPFDFSSNADKKHLESFRVLDTPVKNIIETALQLKRPKALTSQYMEIVESVFGSALVLLFFLLSFAINLSRIFLIESNTRSTATGLWFIFLGRFQVAVILPILPIALPTLMLVSRSYANAYILTLFEALLSSKTEFEDNEDVDEFDAAPAPTKEFVLSWGVIGRKFLDQVIKLDGTHLVRMTGLIESLANTTVFCAVDREGTISSPLPAVDQLLLLDSNGDPVILDLNYNPEVSNGVTFEDNDWQKNLKLLKPFGLSTVLSTDCGVRSGRRRNDLHFKSTSLSSHACPLASRQVCLCHVGREIGFQAQTFSSSLAQALMIETTLPEKVGIQEQVHEYHFEIPSITSRVVGDISDSTTSGTPKQEVQQNFQVFSEGSIELIVESCGDYWNGVELSHFNETTEKKVYDFAQNAIISDLQVVAYSYRPVQHPILGKKIRGLSRSDAYYISLPPPQIDLTHAPLPLTESPIVSLASSPNSPQTRASLSTPQLNTRNKKRLHKDRLVSKLDTATIDVQLQSASASEICKELTKGQTFLCAASFVYPPKPNTVDFVEDLALAGIRFVYFSSAPERESKAYAERLGLEIDWNSCIILSSDDGTGPGYLALHDMKAQLPRGVENIRNHLEKVDDVPLHVSLFAECRPSSIREMCKIFQENGEVVCCIGSSLNDLNVECFVNADISIAVDPIPLHRHKIGQGPVPSLIVASLFNASPCALTLNADTSLYSITQMIREARSLSENGRQAFAFYLGVQIGLSCVVFLGFCTLLPLVIEPYQIMFIVWLIAPLLSCSILFTPHLPDIMTHIPAKNAEHWKDAPKFAVYYSIRFCLLPVFTCISLFWLLLLFLDIPNRPSLPMYLTPTVETNNVILFIQNYVALIFVMQMVVISGTFVYRIESILKRSPFSNRAWILASILCILLQFSFMAISISSEFQYLSALPWWIHIFSILAIFLNLPVQEMVKADDRKKWVLFQKRTKLEFNTKLGMHSPL